MEFLALGAKGTQFLETLLGKIDLLNNIWPFLSYHSRIETNKLTIRRKLEALCSVEADINETLEVAEFHSGNKRKREVENWLRNVQRKKNEVFDLEQQIGDRSYILGPWWETVLEKHIREVEELHEQGKFSEGLLLDAQQNVKEELLTPTLEGCNSPGGVLEKIWECLVDDTVLRIGIYGDEGVGKTAILLNIHNKLCQSTTINHVYWISVVDDVSIHKLQSDIAKEISMDLADEEDMRKRAAKLYKQLRRKKSVLILDGLGSYFDQNVVGIPTEVNGCKLVLGTRSLKVCQRMDCQKTIKIESLPNTVAESLFKKKLGCRIPLKPEIEDIAKKIIEGCGGLPHKIISMAERLRGVDDVSEWRNTLNDFS